ncbi:trichohyalin [Polyergus mexicanus]|uniref:trichohyalin n=1 Tax=Polyergus mexicanus TaxID=615972 RepID=UPI0038B6555B
MQPRVTVALATVWLTVAGLVGGTIALRLSNDQYSPASPHRYAELQQDQTRDWRVRDRPAEDQPFDLWIGSRRPISAEELKALRHNAKFAKQDFSLEKPLKDIVSSKRVYSVSSWLRRLPNIATTEFAADKVDYSYEMPETLSRETIVPRSDLLDDPFVADDTFQDQGPGSMEIYKLDLSKEKALFTATMPPTNLPSRNKSKAPKKTGHLNLKTEIKSTTIDPRVHHRQSNFFEEQRTETPSVNRDAFDIGGVPELQVGCEGLEASPSSHKAKRSIDTPDRKGMVPASVLLDIMPISLDLDYNLSYDEENYEEMDELFKLKKLETVTKGSKPNRGDMDASHLNFDHLDESRRPEKLPIRGDLGKSIPQNSRDLVIDREKSQKSTDLEIKQRTKAERALVSSNDAIRNRRLLWLTEAEGFADGNGERKRARRSANWGFGENEGVVSSDELQTVNERRRQHEMRYHQDVSRRRDQHRGINPDVDSIRRKYENLLEQRRREDEERLRRMQQGGRNTLSRWEEEERRRDEMRRTHYDKYRSRMDHTSTPRVDNEETRRQMEQRQRQEIARNQTQETIRRKEEERRRLREEEEQRRRLQEEETRKRPYNDKWNEENARRSESETPVDNEERRQKLHNEEIRRREEERQRRLQREEQYRSQQEAQRRKEEEKRRRQEDRARNLSEDDRRRLEERRREWLEKKRQQEEDETKRQQPPSNLMRGGHRISHPNDIRQRDRDEERRTREQDERQREQKLREYIARNQPINVTPADRNLEEKKQLYGPEESRDPQINASRDDEYRAREQRRRQEEERKLQDYIRRNQPVNVPSRSNQSSVMDRNWFEERRLIEEARRRDPDGYPNPGARHHGPSAPTYNIDRRGSLEEVRQKQRQEMERRLEERGQRYEAEERRKDPIARRQWEEEEKRLREEARRREEETRKAKSRRYEEDRKRLETLKLQAERRRQETLKERSRSGAAGRARQPEATRPTYYQDPRLLMEHRRRQDSQLIPSNLIRDEEARRAAAEREKQKLMEAERRRQDDSGMRENRPKGTDQWRRQELVRLNSLPVSARIIVVPPSTSSPVSPAVLSRTGFDNEIDFTGINPHREGIQAPKFPVPPTSRPPPQSPGPCIWAIVQCCSPNNNRLVKCFESMGCPGVNWDPDPCRGAIANAARAEVMKFYASASNQ